MEPLVEKAIALACELQEDERYLALKQAQDAADADAGLQDLIGQFNLKRMAVNQEETKDENERDAEKLKEYNREMRSVYAQIMANEHMLAYQTAKEALDELTGKINGAIALALQGRDPHEINSISCTGDCSTCGGCH